MKRCLGSLVWVVIISVFFISCEEDDRNDPVRRNHLKIGGDEYDLSFGVLENNGQGEGNEGVNLDLMLFSKNISISTDDNGDWGILGSGEIIQFDMFTSKDKSLDKGIYSYQISSPYPIGTFSSGIYTIGWKQGDLSVENVTRITSGEILVEKEGEEYEITIDCKDEKGNDVTGYYKGKLQYFNYMSTSESARINPQRNTI